MPHVYEKIIKPALFTLPPETAHEIGLESLRVSLASRAARKIAAKRFRVEPFGELKRFGLTFKNPLGIAAGFDKNGRVVNQLAALGFGFVEVGTVTYDPQQGNPKPRLFRLPGDEALINRLGFNNDGTQKVVERLRKLRPECVVGVNIGKNKDVPNEAATENYLKSFDLAYGVADYIAVNISSPNTPNLRDLQNSENLEDLIGALQSRNRELGNGRLKPLLVKIAPDLSTLEIETITDICMRLDVAGIIATNTTIKRDGLTTAGVGELGAGGLSGRPLRHVSNQVISTIYRYSGGKMPIVGVGGIFTAGDAFEKIAAGACLLQAYTGFVYGGISFARDINVGLAKLIEDAGFGTLDDAVGSGSK